MKVLLSILLVGVISIVGLAQDSVSLDIETNDQHNLDSAGKQAIDAYANYNLEEDKTESKIDSVVAGENKQSEKSLEQQAEEIPVVFGQWWFWVGFFAIILFLKFVIFKK